MSQHYLSNGISVVVPAYQSQRSIGELVRRLSSTLSHMAHELIIVVDGSPDGTWQEVIRLMGSTPALVGIRLGRNAGQHSALLAGVRAARFDVTVTLDDDLQNPPEEIPKLLDQLSAEVDVVYGVPEQSAQSTTRRIGSTAIRRVLTSVLGAPNARELSSFRSFRTSLREGFFDELGPGVSLDALLAWSTDRFTTTTVRHDPRTHGKSNFTIRKLMRFALDMATGYSTRPLQFALRLGLLTGLFGFGLMMFVVGRAVILESAVPGFPFLASTIAFFAGVQLVTIGVIGEYLARIHFRVMRKPSYVIAEVCRTSE